jgi:uncharacterized repeat protein (TIGR01451 family)
MAIHRSRGLAALAALLTVLEMRRQPTIRLLFALSLLTVLIGVGVSPASAVSPIKVTVTIHDIWEVDCDDNDILDVDDTCGNDYYVKVFLPGSPADGDHSPRAEDDLSEVHPGWQISRVVDRDAGQFNIRIQLWDHDSTSGDDQIDIANGDDNLDFFFNPTVGSYGGSEILGPNTGWATGSGTDSAAIFFSVTLGETVDFDGDTLHDGIERGAIVGRDGTIPQYGELRFTASACRPTILMEIDYMDGPDLDATPGPDHTHKPIQAAIDEAVATFANGDVQARPGCPYPSTGSNNGVQFLVFVDDNLGLEVDKINWNTPATMNGQTIRNANFDPLLRPYFHYSLWNHNQPDTPAPPPGGPPVVNGSSGLCCSDSGKDVMVSLGQWANSVGTVRDQAGTLVHELGHALNLGHGGGDGINCKPNYHSIMSYVYQTTGLPDASLPAPTVDYSGDGRIDGRDRLRLDLSRDDLLDLDEDSLNEGAGVGGPTADNFFWDGDGSAPWRTGIANAAVDWDRDTPTQIDALNVPADVNSMGIGAGIVGSQGCPTGTPPPGTLGVTDLNGWDDWANLKYKGSLAAPGGGVEPPPGSRELTFEEAQMIKAAVNQALSVSDLHAHISDSPDPVTAGTQLTYTLEAHNHHATNTAYLAEIEQTLPGQVTFASASPGCTHNSGTVTCLLGNVSPGGSAAATVTVNVPANLVNTGPVDLASTATVSHDGDDSDQSNNSASTTTRVVAKADLSITKSCTPAQVHPGSDVTCTLTVKNAGPSDAAGPITVTDDLPPGLSLKSTTGASAGFTCAGSAANPEVTCTRQQPLAAGASVSFNVTATAAPTLGPGASLTDTATASSPTEDAAAGNNKLSATVKVPTCQRTGSTLTGGPGDDVLCGTSGADNITGGGGRDLVFGFAGADSVTGGDGNDTLIGGAGNDELSGGSGNDRMYGLEHNDTLTGGGGTDHGEGGPGSDTCTGTESGVC